MEKSITKQKERAEARHVAFKSASILVLLTLNYPFIGLENPRFFFLVYDSPPYHLDDVLLSVY